jgi:hypothetical protein
MGKLGRTYTIEQLHRLLQEFGITWAKYNKKPELIVMLYEYCQKHPELTERERIKILNKRLDIQPFRYQVFNEKTGLIENHAYPRDMPEFVASFVKAHHKLLYDGNAHGCPGCEHYRVETDFPQCIGSCCRKESNICRPCIIKKLDAKINSSIFQDEVTCPMCSKPFAEAEIMSFTTKQMVKKCVFDVNETIR